VLYPCGSLSLYSGLSTRFKLAESHTRPCGRYAGSRSCILRCLALEPRFFRRPLLSFRTLEIAHSIHAPPCGFTESAREVCVTLLVAQPSGHSARGLATAYGAQSTGSRVRAHLAVLTLAQRTDPRIRRPCDRHARVHFTSCDAIEHTHCARSYSAYCHRESLALPSPKPPPCPSF
jgi:hypothetical protein